MKKFKKILASLAMGIIITGLTLSFNGCTEQSPLSSDDNETNVSITALGKKDGQGNGNGDGATADTSTATSSAETGSMTARYYKKWREYQGGKIMLSQGSQFELLYGSLTPPAELQGKDVTITMTCVNDVANNQLLFEFGPSGSHFDPPATIWFHYAGSNPKLYLIDESGAYVEQPPEQVDTVNQWLMLKINHFSRYAIGWGD